MADEKTLQAENDELNKRLHTMWREKQKALRLYRRLRGRMRAMRDADNMPES